MENSYLVFRRSGQQFLLIIQVIDLCLKNSRFYFYCQKRIFNYIIIIYIKHAEYKFLIINIFLNLYKSLARKDELTFVFNLHIPIFNISR